MWGIGNDDVGLTRSTKAHAGPLARVPFGPFGLLVIPPCRGTSLKRNSPPPWGRHRALGIFLLYGPRGALFLMSEVLLVPHTWRSCRTRYQAQLGGGFRSWGNSLIRKFPPLGPYRSPMPRALWWSWGGGVSHERGTPVGGGDPGCDSIAQH